MLKRENLPMYAMGAVMLTLLAVVSFQSGPLIYANPLGHEGMSANTALFIVTLGGIYFALMALVMVSVCILAIFIKD